MAIEVFINVRPYQTRLACVEDGQLKQIFYHRNAKPSLVGDLYKGHVAKITKNLNYGFVDLGLKRSGFLYGKDLTGKVKDLSKVLRIGQKILVQIKADPARNKGVRLSQEIGLPGLYLVYLPEQPTKITVSHQISDPKERERLHEIVSRFAEKGTLIVRTFAQGQAEKDIKKDLLHLKKQWEDIQEKFKKQDLPGEIQKGEDPLLALLKDLLGWKIHRLVIDERETVKKVIKWLKAFRPELTKQVEHYKEKRGLFENFSLESQLQIGHKNKVFLKNGGFLIFEELEAFSVIDVNSGRFAGTKDPAKSILKLNLEAAKTIAEQVQLRHLGGIILVDFIDMEQEEDGEKVVSCLEKGFKGDKSHPRVFPMGDLGMVQITRKRSKNSLSHLMTEVCPSCKGVGRKKSLPSIAAELFLKLEGFAPSGLRFLRRKQDLQILCHPKVQEYIEKNELESLEFFNKKLSLRLRLKKDFNLEPENYRIEKL